MKRIHLLLPLFVALPWTLTAQVTTQQPEVTVNVETPGTLGDLILQQTENLTDVVTLHLGGAINDEDVKTLQDRLTRLRNLDALQLQLTDIPEKFLYNHDTLRTVVLPATAVIVRKQAFYGCDSLKQVVFNEGLTDVEASVFATCKKLQNFTLPTTLRRIGASAFDNCVALTRVVLPEGLETLGESSFSNCTGMKELSLPSTLKTIPARAFQNATALQSLTLPESIEQIGDNAFASCRSLAELTLNEGLQTIGQNCFQYATIAEVTLPSTVSYARASFTNCTNLKRIVCLPLVPPANYDYNLILGSHVTKTVDCTLAVPAATINNYKQTVGYDLFAQYEALDDMPASMTVARDFRLYVPADAPKIDLKLVRDEGAGSSDYNGMGTLRIEGDNALSVGRLSMYYDYAGLDVYYKYGNSDVTSNPWGTNASSNPTRKKGFTSIIANTPCSADQVEQTIVLPKNVWAFTSLPFDAKVGDIEILNDRGGQFVIREYEGKQRAIGNTADTWRQLSASSIMQAGKGYIIQGVGYAANYQNDTPERDILLRFHSVADQAVSLYDTDDVVIPLTDYPAEFDHNRGWQLVTNPYPCYVTGAYVDVDAPITIWNSRSKRYTALSLTDDIYVFSPFESFFIQYSDNVTDVTFHKEGRQLGLAFENTALPAPRHVRQNSNRRVYNVYLQNGDDNDRTRFVINPDATTGYEADKDAAYMAPLSDGVSSVYTVQNGIQYAINERPEGDGLIALGLRIAAAGTYTLALQTNAGDDVMLIDQQQQTTVRLDEQGYTFTAQAGTTGGRFLIKVGSTTGVSSLTPNPIPEQSSPTHSLSPKGEGSVFDLQGRRVAQPQQGLYIQNGRKVIVK